MRTLSRLIAAAGIVGAIAATGGTAAVAQGVYLQGPGFGVVSVALHTGNATTTGATPIMTARTSTRGDITGDLTRTSVAGVTATGTSYNVILEQAREEIRALLFSRRHKARGGSVFHCRPSARQHFPVRTAFPVMQAVGVRTFTFEGCS
jgi:hypothetical protein